jgi:RNA 3'-terminal phosphate cyclase
MSNRRCNVCDLLKSHLGFYPRCDGYVNFTCKTCVKQRQKVHRDKMKSNLQWRVRQSEKSKAYYQRKKLAYNL